MKHHIPNIITALRIALCIPMLLAETMSPMFVSCYLLAGVSDMLDGFLARKLCVSSEFGARLDSVADFVFVITAFMKLFPLLNFPLWIWLTIIMITVVKIISLIVSKLRNGKVVFLHTKANKITGFVLFTGMLFVKTSCFQYVMIGAIIMAAYAAVDEMVMVVIKAHITNGATQNSPQKKLHKKLARIEKCCTFASGKSYTTSSCQTPPGPEGSKGRRSSGAIQVAYPFFML